MSTPHSVSGSSEGTAARTRSTASDDGVKKRNRVPVACMFCRSRKLGCDRSKPCNNCRKRAHVDCQYATPLPKSDRRRRAPNVAAMKEQIQSLENLVVTMISEQAPREESHLAHLGMKFPYGSGPMTRETRMEHASFGAEETGPDSQPEALSGPFGHICIDDKETSYVGPEHWAAMLDHITKVKDYFDDENDTAVSHPSDFTGPALLIDPSKCASKSEILSSIPPRAVTDRLISRFFNSKDPSINIIHIPTFQRQYDAFWQDPLSTPIMWISLLLSMLFLAITLYQRCGDALPDPLHQAEQPLETFRRQAVQCLILADYTSLVPHTLEAILIYLHGEYFLSRDALPGIFVVMGMVVRLALRMGYHRDPSHSPQMSPFQGEMRRRVWIFLSQTDMIFAAQNGLQSFIRAEQCDTALPRNLLDDDIHLDMSELPPARPITEPTPLGFMIVKNSIISVYRRIAEHVATIAPTSYETILALDQKLQEVRQAIPPYLCMRSMDQSIVDPPDLIVRRFYLEFGYQNARCTLHREHLLKSQSEPWYNYSRDVCIQAAKRLLEHQSTFHAETQPGGQLFHESGIISSFTSHYFLTAAMIICLELSREHENTERQREDLLAVLDRSHQIWCAGSAQSHEARKAADALAVILRNERQEIRQQRKAPTPLIPAAPTFPFQGAGLQDPMSLTRSENIDSQSKASCNATSDIFGNQEWLGDGYENITWDNMLQMPMMLDWTSWDKQVDILNFTQTAIATAD